MNINLAGAGSIIVALLIVAWLSGWLPTGPYGRQPPSIPLIPSHDPRTPRLGEPGGGYVEGAPRNRAECLARGGTDTGQGCRGYK